MDVGAITISGLASDLDTNSIIAQLAQIRQRPIELLADRQTTYTQNLTVFSQLTAKVLGLGTTMSGLSSGDSFRQVSVSSADTSSVVATGLSGAAVGEFDVQITQLAESHKISSTGLADADEALGLSGDIMLGGEVITVGASDTLEDLRDAINAAGAGASASILTVSDSDHRLFISSLTTGESGALDLVDANDGDILEGLGLVTGSTSIKNAITDGAASDVLSDKLTAAGSVMGLTQTVSGTVTVNGTNVAIDLSADSLEDIAAAFDAVAGVSASVVTTDSEFRLEITGAAGTPTFGDDGNVLVTLGVLSKSVANELDAAQDAQFSIDGVSMARSSNAVDDAIEGVQLQLVGETSGDGVRVSVGRNLNAAVAEVEQFVSYYNDVVSFIDTNQSFDSDSGTGGAFLGNIAVMSLEDSLRTQVTGIVDALGGDLQLASEVGITTDQSDRLVFNSATFRSALTSDVVGVERMFGVANETTGADVEVHSSTSATRDSGADGWAIDITQAATKATGQSATLAGGIVMDETITIGGVGVTLTAGMSLQDSADLLNSMFTAQTMGLEASVVGDQLLVQQELWGASYGAVITSSLDDGSGGTDLGGAIAGEAESYAGTDVAGTIGGMIATGRGQVLTGDDGTDAEGLTLTVSVTAPGDAGVVRHSKGIAARLGDFISLATDSTDGTLTRAAETLSAEIEAIGVEIADMSDDVDRYIAQMQLDFAHMEGQIARSKTLLDWMTLQIDYLPGASSS